MVNADPATLENSDMNSSIYFDGAADPPTRQFWNCALAGVRGRISGRQGAERWLGAG
jgi:hypothetical protein